MFPQLNLQKKIVKKETRKQEKVKLICITKLTFVEHEESCDIRHLVLLVTGYTLSTKSEFQEH